MKLSKCIVSAIGLALVAGSAQGGDFSTSINASIFGNSYNIDIYRVAGDLGAGRRLEPEGMVFHNGTLYVSGDGTAAESNGNLAAYTNGNLTSPTAIGRFLVGANQAIYGPEGLTVNTRGSGYGSFSGSSTRLIGVDNTPSFGRNIAAMNLSAVTVEEAITPFANSDDIAFIAGATEADDRLAIINGGTNPASLNFYSAGATLTLLGGSFNLPIGAKGLLYLPAADASRFFPGAGDSLMVSADGGGVSNTLSLYSLSGTLLTQSALPTGTAVGSFGAIEGLAFDSATGRLFLGDESGVNSQLAVFTVPAPGTGLALGLLGLFAARRRR